MKCVSRTQGTNSLMPREEISCGSERRLAVSAEDSERWRSTRGTASIAAPHTHQQEEMKGRSYEATHCESHGALLLDNTELRAGTLLAFSVTATA